MEFGASQGMENGQFAAAPPGRGMPRQDGRTTNDGQPNGAQTAKFDAFTEHLNQARVEQSNGNLEQAKLHYHRVLQEMPNHAEAHHRLAIIADRQQDYQEAERHYLAAIRVRPRDANLHSDLGYSYLLQNRMPECERSLNQALQIDSNHSRALNNLAIMYGREGNYPLALATFRRAGNEDDAQRKMARFFPESNNGTMPQPAGTAPASAPPYAARPDETALTPSPAEGFRNDRSPMEGPEVAMPAGAGDPGLNDITRRIKADMERARLEAEAARDRHKLAGKPTPRVPNRADVASASGWSDMPTRPTSPGPADRNIVATSRSEPAFDGMRAARPPVREHNLGQYLADIDQAGPPPNTRPAPTRDLPQSARHPGMTTPAAYARPHSSLPANSAPRAAATAHDPYSDPDGLWPPQVDESTGRSRNVQQAEYLQDRRVVQPTPYANPTMPTAAQREAQRLATRIGMEAGPGGMFPYVDPNARTSNEPGYPPGAARQFAAPPSVTDPASNSGFSPPAGSGFVPDLARPSAVASWPGHPRDPRAANPALRGAWPDGQSQNPGHATQNPRGVQPYSRSTSELEPTPDLGAAMPMEPSAANMSYQDHINSMQQYDSPRFDDAEHRAILQQLQRERGMPPSAQSQLSASSPGHSVGSQQYYGPMDPQLQVYEEMRAASHEGYQSKANDSRNPTGMNAGPAAAFPPAGSLTPASANGFGRPSGLSPWNSAGGR